MSVFKSEVVIAMPVNEVYTFLADLNNHRQLMPDNIINWVSTADEASFEIENITKISLKIDERAENNLIRIIPAEKPPFEMELLWKIAADNSGANVTFTITAELSMLMKMVASSPLKKLVEEETQRLAQLFY
jgi:carbon monoxide dehydrogenase subunit G